MPLSNLAKLKTFLEIDNQDIVSKQDFLALFKQMLEMVKAIKETNTKEWISFMVAFKQKMAEMDKAFSEHYDEMEKEMAEIKEVMMKYCRAEIEKIQKEHSAFLSGREKSLASLKREMSAQKETYADEHANLLIEMRKLISEAKETTAEEIRNKLESLKGAAKMDISAVEGLKEALEELKKLASGGGGRLLGGVLNVGMRIETPTGATNGTNKSFTTAKVPKFIVADGATYYENNGFTLSGKTVTMNIAPANFIRSHY